jgi:hypothetical protein
VACTVHATPPYPLSLRVLASPTHVAPLSDFASGLHPLPPVSKPLSSHAPAHLPGRA